MAAAPFLWGSGGAKVTPESLARQRKVAEALMSSGENPDTFWEGLQSAAGDIGGTLVNQRAADDEAAQQAAYGEQFDALGDAPTRDQLIGLASSPWANEGQSSVVSALLGQDFARSDPMYQMGLEKTQLELDALRNPPPPEPQYQVVDGKLVRTDLPTGPELAFDPFADTGGIDPKDAFGNEKDLYAQYSNADPVKLYENVKSGFERVRASATDQTGAGDLSLIYGFMKMVDPGAVVRENDFALAAQAGDFGEQIQGLVSRIVSGQRLPPEQRAEFLAMAEKLYLESAQNLSGINEQFAARAKEWGVDPGNFIRTPEMYPVIQPTVPSPAAPGGTGLTNPFGTSTGSTITLPDGTTLEVY